MGEHRLLYIRSANISDHEFLTRIDLKDEGYTASTEIEMTAVKKEEHSNKILKYITDHDKGAFIIFEDTDLNKPIGLIMYSINNIDDIQYPWTIFKELDRNLFQSDGRFMEIFQLWVHTNYRRLGLATQLKLKLEEDALIHKVNTIYTHTEETNNHVLELNKKLGYLEVRRGPIYDNITRVSLIKHLN
jgi:ribosomal protein S18 acetylase RimI-like enzyme